MKNIIAIGVIHIIMGLFNAHHLAHLVVFLNFWAFRVSQDDIECISDETKIVMLISIKTVIFIILIYNTSLVYPMDVPFQDSKGSYIVNFLAYTAFTTLQKAENRVAANLGIP
uniref:7TM_GPCR_Srx domain-containing protein n=1 Tax=Caenorhabditis tropicalis TaxID=1561998 RepID=A0A1I7TWX5_9PELO